MTVCVILTNKTCLNTGDIVASGNSVKSKEVDDICIDLVNEYTVCITHIHTMEPNRK